MQPVDNRRLCFELAVTRAVTLAEYGIVGKRLVETPETMTIFYDFKPFNSTEPVGDAGRGE